MSVMFDGLHDVVVACKLVVLLNCFASCLQDTFGYEAFQKSNGVGVVLDVMADQNPALEDW